MPATARAEVQNGKVEEAKSERDAVLYMSSIVVGSSGQSFASLLEQGARRESAAVSRLADSR